MRRGEGDGGNLFGGFLGSMLESKEKKATVGFDAFEWVEGFTVRILLFLGSERSYCLYLS